MAAEAERSPGAKPMTVIVHGARQQPMDMAQSWSHNPLVREGINYSEQVDVTSGGMLVLSPFIEATDSRNESVMLCRVEPADDPDFELSAEGGAVDDGQEEDVPISDADTAPQVRVQGLGGASSHLCSSWRPWTILGTCSELYEMHSAVRWCQKRAT